MPERRTGGGRISAAAAIQFDPTERNREASNLYQNARRRDLAARTADNYPAPRPRPRPRTSDGWPVEIRNGLPPLKPYPICNTCGRRGHLEMGHADA